MAKKGDARAGAEPASNKRLRRKLDKLESRLATASDKRDRAQARLDALTIMADELRATLAAAGSHAAHGAAADVEVRAAAPSKPSSRRPTATKRATPGTRRRSTRAASGSGSPARRRRPASGGPSAASS